MSTHRLLDPIIDQGVRNTNFFEGRLLTGQDLRDQQAADREHDRRLGCAIGAGVIEGLEATVARDGADGASPVVLVKKGLALNRDGDIIGLPLHDVEVALSNSIEAKTDAEADFYACAGPPPTSYLPNGAGVYMLVLSPAAAYREQAPRSGLGDEGVVRGCGRRYIQEGARFRLIDLAPAFLGGISDATRTLLQSDYLSPQSPVERSESARLSRFQNLIAHICLGTEEISGFAADPFARTGGGARLRRRGAADALSDAGRLSSCDVPLAILYWTFDGVGFCDNWAVRRRPVPLSPAPDWPLLAGERAGVDAEAAVLQFQDQLEALIEKEAAPASISAETHFHFLPPAGILPLAHPGRRRGVVVSRFFQGRTIRDPVFMEGARLRRLFSVARDFPPVDLGTEEMVWTYWLRQNRQTPGAPTAIAADATAAVFVSGHMPFFGDARFDDNRWNYSNYSSLLAP